MPRFALSRLSRRFKRDSAEREAKEREAKEREAKEREAKDRGSSVPAENSSPTSPFQSVTLERVASP